MPNDDAPSSAPRPSRAKWLLIAAAAAIVIIAGVVVALVVRNASHSGESYGTFGSTDGRNVEVAPGVLAEEFSAPVDGKGTMTVAGPAGTHLSGDYTYTDADNWSLHVTGIEGQVGGHEIDKEGVSGTVAVTGGVVSASADGDVPDTPNVLQGWQQTSNLHIGYGTSDGLAQGEGARGAAAGVPAIPTTPGAFSGTMNISTTNGTGKLTGSGTVATDGSYTVTFTGTLTVDAETIALSGTYESAGWKGAKNPNYLVTGTMSVGTVGNGLQIQSGSISASDENPQITGTLTASVTVPAKMTMVFDVAIQDENNWAFTVDSTLESTWTSAAIPGLTVAESTMHGQISAVAGKKSFNMTSDSTIVVDGVTMNGNFVLTSATTWTFTVSSGSGYVLGSPNQAHIDSVSGHLDYNSGAVSGSLKVHSTAATTVVLPAGWTHSTDLAITYSKTTSQATATATVSASYTGTDGKNANLYISGNYATPGAYKLTATGTAGMGDGGTMSLSGVYESKNYVDNGTTRTAPWWSITSSLTNIPMGGGSTLASGSLTLASNVQGWSGSATFKPASNSSFAINVGVVYTDSANWAVNVGTQSSSTAWNPGGFTNLTINPNQFSGNVTKTAGAITWGMTIAGVTWNNVATGVRLVSDFSLSTTCSLGTECPGTAGTYFGIANGSLTFPSPFPSMTARGSLLTTGGWGRFDASAGSFTYNGIGFTNSALTVWKGSRTDSFNPNLGMPTLSGTNNGWNMEFCGNFNAAIPDVTTITTGGCLEWTPNGVVIGQVAMGGNVNSGTNSGGVSIGITTLQGFAWSNLTSLPTIRLNSVNVPLPNNVSQLTGNMTIPGNVMKAMGKDIGQTIIPATGWVSSGDFALDGTIDVGLSHQGVTIDSMNVHIGKTGHAFNLAFTANGRVKIKDTQFPLTTTVGFTAGSTTEVYVSVSAKGVRSTNPTGTFDYPNQFTAGDFEPQDTLIIDGSWDSRPPTSLVTHGDYENAIPQGNLLTNADFEKYTGGAFIGNGDFEDATYANQMVNSDAEDSNFMPNGDFDSDNPTWNWSINGNSNGSVSWQTIADPGPGETNGTNIIRMKNNAASGTTQANQTWHGMLQWWSQDTYSGVNYTLGAWLRSPDSSTTRYQFALVQDTAAASGCSGTDNTQYGNIGTVGSQWTYVSYTFTGVACRGHIAPWINVIDGQRSLDVDNVSMTMTRTSNTSCSTTYNTTEWTASNTAFARWDCAGENHTASGVGMYMMHPSNSSGYVALDMQTAADQYGTYTFSGYFNPKCTFSGKIRIETVGGTLEYAEMPFTNMPANTWTRETVTANFGGSGHTSYRVLVYGSTTSCDLRFDDLYAGKVPYNPYSTTYGAAGQTLEYDPSGTTNSNTATSIAHTGSYSLSLSDFNWGSNGVAAYADFVPSGGISVGSTYTASVWMRSPNGADGNLWLRTMDGTSESVSTDVYPGTNWTQVTISLTIRYSNHTRFRIEFDTGVDSRIVYFDDLSITAVNRVITQDSADVWVGSGSTSFGVYDNAPGAHSDNGYLAFSTQSGTPSVSKTVSFTGQAGQSYAACAWITGPQGVNGSIRIDAGNNNATTTFTQGSGYAQQCATTTLTANATSVKITVSGSGTNQGWQLDDASITLAGLTQDDPWTPWTSTGFMSAGIFADRTQAHDGTNYAEIKSVGVDYGSYFKDITSGFTAGKQYTLDAWLRSPNGTTTPVNVCIGSIDGAGAWINNDCITYNVGSSWTDAFSSTVLPSNTARIRVSVDTQKRDIPIDVDDVTLRQDSLWTTTSPYAEMSIGDDRNSARDGSGFLRVYATGGGVGVQASGAATINGGSYTMAGFIRNTSGWPNVTGTLYVTASGGSSGNETFTKTFTTSSDWQDLTFTFSPTKQNTTFTEKLVLNGAGMVDIDSFNLQPLIIVQSDPWTTTGNAGYNDWNDPSNAHTDNGVGIFWTSGTASAGIQHNVPAAANVGTRWTLNAWLKTVAPTSSLPSGGEPVTYCIQTVGGILESTCNTTYLNSSGWVNVGATLPSLQYSSHTGLKVVITTTGPGVAIYVDDVVVQPKLWSVVGSGHQLVVDDAANAQSGMAYLRVSKDDSTTSGVYMDISGNVSSGTNEVASFWVKSGDGNDLPGHATLVATTSSGTTSLGTVYFTANSKWQQVIYTFPVNISGVTSLRFTTYVDAAQRNLYLDSVDIDPNAGSEPDGINSDLPHPESGYIYLWDNAWGITGAHLWAISAQISIIGGSPSLGVGATTYYDPTKAGGAMVGTAWLRGQMTANISTREPCFSFGFDGTGTGTAISIKGGAITASKFQITVAPRGCTVGNYMLAPGSVLAFDAGFGDATIHFDMEMGRDSNGLPTFYFDQKIMNVKLGGITYNTMELTINVSASSSSIAFVGDFDMPMGKFYGAFSIDAGGGNLHQYGQVNVTDWTMAAGAFDVSSFNYYMDVYIPLGSGSCGTFETSTDGNLKMGSKSYNFNGDIRSECGVLKKLDFWFQYLKGGVSYTLYLRYDSTSHVLAGGLDWSFERSMSWKFLSHRYKRHPQFGISLDFYMDFDKPSEAYLKLAGKISVSGGDGSVTCTIGGSNVDDSCSLHVHVSIGGGRTYDSSW